jgi:hypothetical protein
MINNLVAFPGEEQKQESKGEAKYVIKEKLTDEELDKCFSSSDDYFEDENGTVRLLPTPKKDHRDLTPEQQIADLHLRMISFEKMIYGMITDLKSEFSSAVTAKFNSVNKAHEKEITEINFIVSKLKKELL